MWTFATFSPPALVEAVSMSSSPLLALTPFTPHVDDQREGISNVDWTRDTVSSGAVPGSDLHVALGGRQCEVHGVRSVHSERRRKIRVAMRKKSKVVSMDSGRPLLSILKRKKSGFLF